MKNHKTDATTKASSSTNLRNNNPENLPVADSVNHSTVEGRDMINRVNQIYSSVPTAEIPEQHEVFESDEEFEFHSIRENDPMMDKYQLTAHGVDMSINEQLQAILLIKEPGDKEVLKIVDGRSTYKAGKQFKIKLHYEIFNGTIDEAKSLIKSRHTHRTLYSKDILACFASEEKGFVKEKNKKLISEKMKAISRGNKYDISISTNEYLEYRWGVGKTYINRADKILKNDKFLFSEVKKGLRTLADAEQMLERIIKQPKTKKHSRNGKKTKIQNIQLNLFEQAKVSELISLGIKKVVAIQKVQESAKQIQEKLTELKKMPMKKIELTLSEVIIDFIDNSEVDMTIGELFSAWVVNNFNFDL